MEGGGYKKRSAQVELIFLGDDRYWLFGQVGRRKWKKRAFLRLNMEILSRVQIASGWNDQTLRDSLSRGATDLLRKNDIKFAGEQVRVGIE